MLRAEGILENLQNGISISWGREAVDPKYHDVPDVALGRLETGKGQRKDHVHLRRERRFRRFEQTAGFLKKPAAHLIGGR